jgi:hypothetical protein
MSCNKHSSVLFDGEGKRAAMKLLRSTIAWARSCNYKATVITYLFADKKKLQYNYLPS